MSGHTLSCILYHCHVTSKLLLRRIRSNLDANEGRQSQFNFRRSSGDEQVELEVQVSSTEEQMPLHRELSQQLSQENSLLKKQTF